VSALTKTFVLLHVVMSMLLAAGLIVFVNRVDTFQQTAASNKASLQLAEQRAQEATAELAVARAANANVTQTASAAIKQAQDAINQREAQIAQLNTDLVKAESARASAEAALTGATGSLKVAQENQGTLQGQLASLRQNHDKLMQQFTEANLSINDISARLSQTDRQRKDLQEQVADLTQKLAQGGGRTDAGGGDGAQRASGRMGINPNVNVNGVVREKRVIAGVPYATISVGSADAIQRGMRLRVLGGRGGQEFLGYVDVTNVEPDEAIGRLTGPRVNEVTVNSQVVSNL